MLRVEIVSPDIYFKHAGAVDDLQAEAVQPNIFAEPAVVRAAQKNANIFLVWRNNGTLIGAWPFVKQGSVIDTRLHDYMMLTVPLIHKKHADEVWNVLLSAFEKMETIAIHCPFMPEKMLQGLRPVLQARHQKCSILAQENRGFLSVGRNFQTFYETIFSAKARRTLKKQRRDMGETAYSVFEGDNARIKLNDFFKLESAGWKGRRGTAIINNTRDGDFITQVLQYLPDDKFFLSALMSQQKPLAMGLVFKIRGSMWYLKMAYEEAAARFSPGVHYALELAKQVLHAPDFHEADSCAPLGLGRHVAPFSTPHLFSDILIATRPYRSTAFFLLATKMRFKIQARNFAKNLLKKIMR
ncbi:MAG: GNAT family N-acetyltransferase [Pseudomonadota bacterium]